MRHLLLLLLLLPVAGCKVGPDYERPEFAVPESHRGAEQSDASVGDVEWFRVFSDKVLQRLIKTALQNNHDVRLAAERVIEARARVTIAKAERLPEVTANADGSANQVTRNGSVPTAGTDRNQESVFLGFGLTWEIDFWGRVKRLTEAERAVLLETEFARHAVIQTLVADLALAYFDLLELDAELAIANRTVVSRRKSLNLVQLRLKHGVANKVELRQAESLVIEAAGLIPDLALRSAQQENLIRFLMGDNPGSVPRGPGLLDQNRALDVPAGMPSALLDRRPDVRAAEQQLVAANARIGAAKAELFPTIRLTGSGGVASSQLKNLFEGDSVAWSLALSATQPIFNAGRLRANVDVTESQQRQAAIRYLKTLQFAFREVADALIGHEKLQEVRGHRDRLEAALNDQVRLSRARYRGGVTSYLEVLDSERDHFDAELGRAQAIRDELFSVVLLYRSLGGGWQFAQATAAQPEASDAPDKPE